jgi:hypothetical protein
MNSSLQEPLSQGAQREGRTYSHVDAVCLGSLCENSWIPASAGMTALE